MNVAAAAAAAKRKEKKRKGISIEKGRGKRIAMEEVHTAIQLEVVPVRHHRK